MSKDLLSLYELPEAYEAIFQALAETEGEITPEIQERLDLIQDSLETKAERIGTMVQRLTRQGEAAKAEADRLLRLSCQRKDTVDSLKGYLLRTFRALGVNKLDTNLFRFRVQANSQPAVSWRLDPEAIPAEFRKEVPPPAPTFDRSLVLARWKENPESPDLPEGFSVEVGSHIRIA
jgi:hypothetical protein